MSKGFNANLFFYSKNSFHLHDGVNKFPDGGVREIFRDSVGFGVKIVFVQLKPELLSAFYATA